MSDRITLSSRGDAFNFAPGMRLGDHGPRSGCPTLVVTAVCRVSGAITVRSLTRWERLRWHLLAPVHWLRRRWL